VNSLACKKFRKDFGEENVFRLISKREIEITDLDKPKNLLFNRMTDYNTLLQVTRKKPPIKEQTVNSIAELESFLEEQGTNIIPICTRSSNNKMQVIAGFDIKVNSGDSLIYIEASTKG